MNVGMTPLSKLSISVFLFGMTFNMRMQGDKILQIQELFKFRTDFSVISMILLLNIFILVTKKIYIITQCIV